jgi:hypothetical protein
LRQHTGYVVSEEIGPGDVYVIRPGHEACVTGDETYVGVDFSSDMERIAKEQQ